MGLRLTRLDGQEKNKVLDCGADHPAAGKDCRLFNRLRLIRFCGEMCITGFVCVPCGEIF